MPKIVRMCGDDKFKDWIKIARPRVIQIHPLSAEKPYHSHPPVIIEAQIPPPMINQTAERIKNTFALFLLRYQLAKPVIKNITGGPNVIKKQIAIKVPIPSIVLSLELVG